VPFLAGVYCELLYKVNTLPFYTSRIGVTRGVESCLPRQFGCSLPNSMLESSLSRRVIAILCQLVLHLSCCCVACVLLGPAFDVEKGVAAWQ
jgi:hypothetical protein